MIVGYESKNYSASRNTYDEIPGVERRKIRRVPVELLPLAVSSGYKTAFIPLGRSGCDLVHLWHRTSFGRAPWGVSFSYDLPFENKRKHPRAVSLLRRPLFKDLCRFILPVSNHALRVFKGGLSDGEWEHLRQKVQVVAPAQRVLPRAKPYRPPGDREPLKLMMVGITFFGKGGEALLGALDRVGDELNIHLTLVSPIRGGDYGGTPPLTTNPAAIRERVAAHPRIAWHEKLANPDVLELMQQAHVGLLPTWADTFGYAALEFMASGVPLVASNVQALPEFTGPDTGWAVEVPTDEFGVWLGRSQDPAERARHYQEAVDSCTTQLEVIFRQIREDPMNLEELHRSVRERIATQFDQTVRSRKLDEIYTTAVR